MYISNDKITVITYYYPIEKDYCSQVCQASIRKYCETRGYNFYLNNIPPVDNLKTTPYFMRLYLTSEAMKVFPDTEWFLWLDSDVYIENYEMLIQDQIDLDPNYKYHLFHERPWSYMINSGVKFIHRDALINEEEQFEMRTNERYDGRNRIHDQLATIDYITTKMQGQFKIHDPYILNCIYFIHKEHVSTALFIHLAGAKPSGCNRNNHMKRVNDRQKLI